MQGITAKELKEILDKIISKYGENCIVKCDYNPYRCESNILVYENENISSYLETIFVKK